MGNHIIVITSLEEPKVFFSQEEFEKVITSLRLDPSFYQKRCNIYALQPDPGEGRQSLTLPAIRLLKVGSTDDRHPSTSFFQEALHYLGEAPALLQKESLRKWKEMLTQLEESLPNVG